eukprot:4076238-Amphidinium_carterae.2
MSLSCKQQLFLKVCLPQVSKSTVKHKTKKQTQAGGTYRLYVKLTTQGQRGKPNLRQVANDYKNARRGGAAMLKQCEVLGKAVAMAAKLVPSAQRTFGMKSMQLQRLRLKRQAELLLTDGFGVVELATKILADVSNPETSSVAIQKARAVSRVCREQKLADEKGNAEVLQEFNKTCGMRRLQSLQAVLPTLSTSSFEVVPDPDLFMVEGKAESLAARSKLLSSIASTHPESGLSTYLDGYWGRLHATINEKDGDVVASHVDNPTPCFLAGVCLCGNTLEGAILKNVRNRLLSSMKTQLRNKDRKDLLHQGLVVLKFVAKEESAAGNTIALKGSDGRTMELLLHIALMSFSPYVPAFHVVSPVPCPDSENPEYMYVQVPRICPKHFSEFECQVFMLIGWSSELIQICNSLTHYHQRHLHFCFGCSIDLAWRQLVISRQMSWL